MKTFIMIPIYNKHNFTLATINDLSRLDKNHKIIIIDNGSEEKSSLAVEKAVVDKNNDLDVQCSFHRFRFDYNKGFGKASNYAYNKARELGGLDNDFYIFLNNDIRVKSKKDCWTKILSDEATENNLVGPTGGFLDNNYNFVYETEDKSKKINYMIGWCLGMYGSVAERIACEFKDNMYRGVFPDYNLAYFEDSHQGIVAKKLGIEFKLVELPLVHFKRTTAKMMNLSKLYIKGREEFLKRINK